MSGLEVAIAHVAGPTHAGAQNQTSQPSYETALQLQSNMVEPERRQTYFSSLFEESDDRRGVSAADRPVQRTHPAAVHMLH